jgi:hypothetical protein
VVRFHAQVDVAGVNAMTFGMRDRNEEGKNSEYQNNESNCGQCSH